jgi:uncharacterized protein YraI
MSIQRISSIVARGTLALCAMFATTVADAQQAFASRRTSLRAGPDRGYPQVAWIGVGTGVYVNGCVSGYHWCDVSAGGARGWISARHLTYAYQDRRVMIYGNGPSFGTPVVGFALGSYWDSYYRDRPWYHHHNHWSGWRPGMVAPRPEYYRAAPAYVAPRQHYAAPHPHFVAPRVRRDVHPSLRVQQVRPHRTEFHAHRGHANRTSDPHRSAGSAVFVAPRQR